MVCVGEDDVLYVVCVVDGYGEDDILCVVCVVDGYGEDDVLYVVCVVDGYGEDDVLYTWTHGADGSIKMAPDMKLSQYDLVGLSAGNATSMSAGEKQQLLLTATV